MTITVSMATRETSSCYLKKKKMTERFLNFQIQEIQELKENSENKNNKKKYIDLAKCLDKLGRKQDFTTSLHAYKRKQTFCINFSGF